MVNAEAIKRDVIVIGASAGGVETLGRLLSALPPGLPAIVAVVQHRSPVYTLSLATLLARYSPLPLIEPDTGQPLQPGTVYIAPPDRHMVFEQGIVKLSRGPTEHRSRPAVDVLFRSAAATYRERVVGVVLTGAGEDGTAGLRAIKAAGGLSVVQDPSDARHPGMPSYALRHDGVDLILHLKELPAAFLALAKGEPVGVAAR
jgi:two-component system, chemotaxis family, protein-glutamate methylesterase/glutaminase